MSQKNLLSFFLGVIGLLALSSTAYSQPKEGEGGRYLFEHYCAVCHGKTGEGNGPNAEHLDPPPANLTDDEIASRSDQELYEVIEKGGAGVDLALTMPPWGKTLSRSQIESLVAYIRVLQAGPPPKQGVRLADIKKSVAAGQQSEYCGACHMDKKGRQIAPDLSHEGSKFNREWLYQFLKNPDRVRPLGFIPLTKTKMPNFQFSDEEAHAVTDYLMTLTEDRFAKANVEGITESDVEKGKELFSNVYGCDGCHKTAPDGEGGIVGPNLSLAAKRLRPEWIYTWLQNPPAVRPDSPMPNFGLPGADIRALTAYILSLGDASGKPVKAQLKAQLEEGQVQKGKGIVEKKHCTFCHILNTKEEK